MMGRSRRLSINATEPGLGKTLSCTAYIALLSQGRTLRERRARAASATTPAGYAAALPLVPMAQAPAALIIVPDQVIPQWRGECDRVGISHKLYSDQELRNDEQVPADVDVLLVGFGVAKRLANFTLDNRRGGTNHKNVQLYGWPVIVVDECEEMGKTEDTSLKVTVSDLVNRNGNRNGNARATVARATVIGMTGTPNKFEDETMWARVKGVMGGRVPLLSDGTRSQDSQDEEQEFRTTRNDLSEDAKEHMCALKYESTAVESLTGIEKAVTSIGLAGNGGHDPHSTVVNPKLAMSSHHPRDTLPSLRDAFVKRKNEECASAARRRLTLLNRRAGLESLNGSLDCNTTRQELNQIESEFKHYTGQRISRKDGGDHLYCTKVLCANDAEKAGLIEKHRNLLLDPFSPCTPKKLRELANTFPWHLDAVGPEALSNPPSHQPDRRCGCHRTTASTGPEESRGVRHRHTRIIS